MGNAAPGGHQVHRAGGDLERIALAVAMHDAAIEQVGDGGKSDVRVRAHVEPLPSDELNRSHLIEEDEGTDHLALAMRQRAAHREAVAEIAYARNNDELERVAGSFVAEHWIGRRQPAHCSPPFSFDRPRVAHRSSFPCKRESRNPHETGSPLSPGWPELSSPGLARRSRLGRALPYESGWPGQARP